MMKSFSAKGMLIEQHDLQQIILRGKGDGSFAETVNKEVSLLPPSDNLRMVSNDKFLFAKQSFDQWSLVCLKKQPDEDILKLVSAMNSNEEVLSLFSSETVNLFLPLILLLERTFLPLEVDILSIKPCLFFLFLLDG